MITDTIDLEHLLTGYEPEAVLVGPLLSLSINASYRYFYLAGKGSKVYQSIGLGFLENESHAQKQRADIIEKLKPRFAELLLFDSHLEMARAVQTRWRTEETARVLAAAEREAEVDSAPRADYENVNERGDEHTLRDEQSERLLARELLEHDQSAPLVSQAGPTGGTSVAEERRSITLDQGDQLAAEPPTAPERTRVVGREGPKKRTYQKGFTSDDQFRELAGTLFYARPDKPNQADGPASVDMIATFQASAGLSSNHEAPEAAGRNAADDNGASGRGPSKHHNHIMGKLTRELFEQTDRDEARSMRLPSAANLPTSTKDCGKVLAQQRRDSGLAHDSVASAILKLASPTQLDDCPIPPVEPSCSLSESPAVLAAEPTASHLERVPNPPVKHTRGRPAVLWLGAVVAAILLFWTFVLPSTRQEVDKAVNALPAEATNLPPKSAAAVPSLPVSQRVDANGSAQHTQAAPGKVPAPAAAAAAPSQTENTYADAAQVSDRHDPVAQQARTADQSEAKEIAKLVNRGMEYLKSGDLESARLSLQRAVEAIPSATTSQVEPSRKILLLGTSQGQAVKQPGLQNEHSLPIKSSSDERQLARTARLESGGAVADGQTAPPQEDNTVRHIEPDEIATLLSRGMDLVKSGDFASARVLLRRAAEAGNAEAALALGSTYDPSVLRQLGAVAIAADVAQARQWYEKAVEFGSAAAGQRLARLAQPPR